jgi:nucleoside 2-deoxyribosyltransferase
MAFGRADCDALYDRLIEPTLRDLGISPIRVDRRQHRDDLNNFIIRMLKEADIVLADLTYARPSVYYEAGFAERVIPIVYTARKDHLSRNQPDDRLRVHFDLEMKKIVAWRDPDDPTFTKRLKQRITYLVKPIAIQKAKDNRLKKDRQAFLLQSVSDRCQFIHRVFKSQLRAKRFWFRPLSDLTPKLAWSLKPSISLVGAKLVGTKCVLCVIVAGESITKKQIQETWDWASSNYLVWDFQEPRITELEEHYYFCSLRNLPESRLTSSFPEAKPGSDSATFSLERTSSLRYGDIPSSACIYLLSSLDSALVIRERVGELMGQHSAKKSNKYTQLVARNILFGRRKSSYK